MGSRPSLRAELGLDLAHLDLSLRDVDRNADRAAGVLQATLNRLTDPQGAVGGELEALAPVELLDRADQAQHALLDQVLQRKAVALVAARLRDDQSQVGVDHPVLGLQVAALDALGQLDLLRGGQQLVHAGLPEEQIQRLQRTVDRRHVRPLGQLMPAIGRHRTTARGGRAARPLDGTGLGVLAADPALYSFVTQFQFQCSLVRR